MPRLKYAEAVKAYEVEYEPENEWNRSHYEKALKKKLAKCQRKSVQERPFDEETVHTNDTHHQEEPRPIVIGVSMTLPPMTVWRVSRLIPSTK